MLKKYFKIFTIETRCTVQSLKIFASNFASLLFLISAVQNNVKSRASFELQSERPVVSANDVITAMRCRIVRAR